MTPLQALPFFGAGRRPAGALSPGLAALGSGHLLALSFVPVALTPILLNLGRPLLALAALVLGELLLFAAARQPTERPGWLSPSEANTLAAAAYLGAAAVYALLHWYGAALGLGGVALAKLVWSIREDEPSAWLCAGIACLAASLYVSLALVVGGGASLGLSFARADPVVVIVLDLALALGVGALFGRLVQEDLLHPLFAALPLCLGGLACGALTLAALSGTLPLAIKLWLGLKAAGLVGLGLRVLFFPPEPFGRAL
jgi:hypothetical protein